MFKKNLTKKNLAYLVLFVVACILIYFLSKKIQVQEVVVVVRKAGVWGPVILILLLASTFIFAPLSSTPFFIAGYLLFDKNIQIFNYLAAMLAAGVNFWIARLWGRQIVIKMTGEKNMEKVDRLVVNSGLKSLIFLRVFQLQMHDVISYTSGLTKINFWPYFLVSVLAPIPWTALWYFVIFNRINNLAEFLVWFNLSYLPFWAISFLLVIWWKKKASLSSS